VPWLLIFFALIDVGAGFGGAEVVGYEATAATIEIDLSVHLADPAGPALVHLTVPGETLTRPLVERAGREWGAVVQVRRANWQVVFEDVGSGTLSTSVSLLELGLDPALLGILPSAPTQPEADAAPVSWSWLVVAAVAATVSVLVVAVGFPRRQPRGRHRRAKARHRPQ
jgi:hypothetical protein